MSRSKFQLNSIHDQAQLNEGESVTMVLSDQPILNKDGELNDSSDELSNVRIVDEERAKHNDEVRKQVEYDPTKEGQYILEKHNDLKTGPKGFLIGGSTLGVIEEQDPEKRLAILTALGEKQSLEGKLKPQSDFYTSEEMAKMMASRKLPKRKTKRKKEKKEEEREDQIGGAGPTGIAQAGRPADAGSDEEDTELCEQLSKQRRLVRRSDAGSVKKGEAALNAVSDRTQALASAWASIPSNLLDRILALVIESEPFHRGCLSKATVLVTMADPSKIQWPVLRMTNPGTSRSLEVCFCVVLRTPCQRT